MVIIFFVMGLIFGSFYNVVAYRLSNNMSLVKPKRSICPKCKKELGILELIPIFSYIFLKGKCKKCHEKISLFYPFIEFLTAFTFALSYHLCGFSLDLLIMLIMFSYFSIVIYSDFKYMIIPDEVTFIVIILTVILILIKALYWNVIVAFITIISTYVFAKIISIILKKDAMGGGDIKLMFFVGLLLNYNAILAFFISSFLAFPAAFYVTVKNKNSKIPFGPFLLLATILIYIFKLDLNTILSWL